MKENKKVLDIIAKRNIDEQLRSQGVSRGIIDNPRYQGILSRISAMTLSNRINEFSTMVDAEGNVVLTQSENNRPVLYMKYYIDENDGSLKRIKIEYDYRIRGNITKISTYNEDGIEEKMQLREEYGDETYLSETTRVEGRPDIIKIARISKKDEVKRLSDVYQSRIFFAALEDIDPDEFDIDPLEVRPLAIAGKGSIPPIYMDISPEETDMLKEGIEPFLPDDERGKMLKEYKRTNKFYCRTTVFEKGIANMLDIDSRTIDDE